MEEIKFTSHEGAMQNDKPSVLIFCADWVKPCKDLEAPLQSLYDQYGKDVNFVHIDADDPNSQNLVKKYSIGPLPAILYLSSNNVVMSYTLGLSDETGMRKEILKLMNEPTAKAEDSGNANQ
jgi:thiol-disulfide isomerase/thioredoxin